MYTWNRRIGRKIREERKRLREWVFDVTHKLRKFFQYIQGNLLSQQKGCCKHIGAVSLGRKWWIGYFFKILLFHPFALSISRQELIVLALIAALHSCILGMYLFDQKLTNEIMRWISKDEGFFKILIDKLTNEDVVIFH